MQTFDNQWNDIHNKRKWGKYPSEDVIRFVMRNFGSSNRKETAILDLCCGAGANSWFLAKEGFFTVAFDGALSAVQKTRHLCDQNQGPAHVFQADAGMLPLKENSFDAVIDCASITSNCSKGVKQILKQCYNALKPGGKIFSTSLFGRKMTGYKTGQKIDNHSYRNIECGPLKDTATVHFFSEEEIIELWTQTGFKNLIIDHCERTDKAAETQMFYYLVSAIKP